MYAFEYRNRQIALRPEFTASVVRAYVAQWQGLLLPLRLAYHGPVFRYEKPQAGRSRQYTEAGVELLGAAGPAADAEVIHLALAGLGNPRAARLRAAPRASRRRRLPRLAAARRARARLVPLEHGAARARRRRPAPWPPRPAAPRRRGRDRRHAGRRGANVDPIADAGARRAVARRPRPRRDERLACARDGDERLARRRRRLRGGNRPPEEIVERLLLKLRRPRLRFDSRRRSPSCAGWSPLQGAPAAVLRDLRALLADYRLDQSPVAELEEVLALPRSTATTSGSPLTSASGAACTTTPASSSRSTTGGTACSPAARGATTTWPKSSARAAPSPPPASPTASSAWPGRPSRAAPLPPTPRRRRPRLRRPGATMADLIPLAEALRGAGWRAGFDLRGAASPPTSPTPTAPASPTSRSSARPSAPPASSPGAPSPPAPRSACPSPNC